MRSAASSNDIMTIIKDNFRKYWSVPLIACIWYLLSGFISVLMEDEPKLIQYNLQILSENGSFGYVMAILILGIGSGMTVFAYLRSPGSADYMHSLPISRNRLFLANLLSGILMIAVPILLNAIVMSLVAGNIMFIKWAVMTGVCCFAIFAITVFAGMLSGNTLMHLFNALFFNGFVTVFLAVIDLLCESFLLGYTTSESWGNVVSASNPLTAFIFTTGVSRVTLCIIYFLVGVIALALAGFLYHRRKIERTGESVVFPWVRAVLFLYCIFCGCIMLGLFTLELLSSDDGLRFGLPMIVGMLIGALLIFVIGSLLIDRSAKIFTRRNMLPAAAALVLAFAVTLCISGDVTGYGEYVPDSDEIETVYLDPWDEGIYTGEENYDTWNSRFDAEYYETGADKTVSIGDHKIIGMQSDDNIETVRVLHQCLIDQDRSDSSAMSGSIELVYELKNGHKVRRSYDLYMGSGDEGPVDLQEGIFEGIAEYYDSKEYKEKYSLKNLKADVFGKGTIRFYPHAIDDEDSTDGEGVAVPNKYGKELVAALDADFMAGKYMSDRMCESFVTVQLPKSYEEISFPVPENSKHMKAWLEKHEKEL